MPLMTVNVQSPPSLEVGTLRELFRNLRAWRALVEDHGCDTITHRGVEYSIWDIEYLYQQAERLPHQQRRAITLCLIEGMRETDAAVAMGVSPTNPVAMYATSGIKKIISWIDSGELPRYRSGAEAV